MHTKKVQHLHLGNLLADWPLLGLADHFFEFIRIGHSSNQLPTATARLGIVNDDALAARVAARWAARAVRACRLTGTGTRDLLENGAVKIYHVDIVRHATATAHHLGVRVVRLDAILVHLDVRALPYSLVIAEETAERIHNAQAQQPALVTIGHLGAVLDRDLGGVSRVEYRSGRGVVVWT